ncbi:hypothetical protein M0805_008607 [Coniferiporia weirii]|nr:hypothetical protein M0805_008607 [Coniferiporia weirii]
MSGLPNFNGKSDVEAWISSLELSFSEKEMSEDERLELAVEHLRQPVVDCLNCVAVDLENILEGPWEWSWTTLKAALLGIQATRKILIKTAKIAAVAGVASIAGPAIIVGGLNLIGFSAVGPVAGSIAAGIQSVFYGGAVQAGSAFAFCQSAAMGGAALATLSTGSAIGAAGAAAIKGVTRRSPSKSWDDGDNFKARLKLLEDLYELTRGN